MPLNLRRCLFLLAVSSIACSAAAARPAHPVNAAACEQLQYTDQIPPLPEGAPQDSRVVVTADQAEMVGNGLSTLSGMVRLIQGQNQFSTQIMDYDEQERRVRVRADSLFRNPNFIIKSEGADFDLNSQTGVFSGTEFTIPERSARGTAETFTLRRSGTADLERVSYTTCSQNSRAWHIDASEIHLDQNEGLGTARNARLVFGGIPILYAPYFQFPISNARRTGLLFPTLGQSTTTGVDLRWPLYLNLAPNYDAELIPRYMSRRGTQLGSQFRYLFDDSTGNATYEYLNKDEVLGVQRSFFDFQHRGLLSSRLGLEAHYAEVSDRGYFEDLGSRLESSSTSFLDRNATLTYAAPASYIVTAKVQNYQIVDRTVPASASPYQRLPLIRVDSLTRKEWKGIRLGFSGEFANFVQSSDVPQGQRLDLIPYLLMQKDRNAWNFTSQLDLRRTQYELVEIPTDAPHAVGRTLPEFSAQTGLRFERLTPAGRLQTLEPTLFYLYVPYREQNRLPLFDSGEPDFDFVQLFARNRFSGNDRIADANHLATAFTTRLIDPDDGSVELTASLGQIYRFNASRVALQSELLQGNALQGNPPPDTGSTDLIGALDYRLSPQLQVVTAAQWSPDRQELERTSLLVRYRENGRRADIGYRYRRDILEQADLSATTPIAGPFNLIGRWRYSLPSTRSLESLAGIEYTTCCWALRTTYRRFLFNTLGEYTTGVYLQLELKGLASIGTGYQSLLPPMED